MMLSGLRMADLEKDKEKVMSVLNLK